MKITPANAVSVLLLGTLMAIGIQGPSIHAMATCMLEFGLLVVIKYHGNRSGRG